MLLTERQLRKVIQESILAHSHEKDITILESKAKRSKMLVETHRGTGFITFGSLLERADRGLISGEQLCDILEEDFERINRQLLQEGILDVVQDAYEKVKGGAIKLKDTISDATAAAMAKINEKYIEWTTKIWMVAKKGPEAAAKVIGLISKGLSVIKAFKKKHPILYKIIIFTLICIALFILMAIMSSPAHAEIVNKSGKPMGDASYNATLGTLKQLFRETGDMDKSQELMNAMTALEKAHKGTEQIQVTQLSSWSQTAVGETQKIVSIMRKASAEGNTALQGAALDRLQGLADTAKQAQISMNGISAPMGI